MLRRNRYCFSALAILVVGLFIPQAHAVEIRVFAAASMLDAVTAVGDAFEQRTEEYNVRYVFSSSSTLARQIIAGAPADVYISANIAWMYEAVDSGTIIDDTIRPIAGNRLVLVGGSIDKTHFPGGLPSLVTPTFPMIVLLDADGPGRLAVGDPAHVPAGQYARQSLEHLGLWHLVSDKLAPMPHVRAALNLVARGEAPLGIVYASDAVLVPTLEVLASFPVDSHLPITYLAGQVKSGKSDSARTFLNYLSSQEAAQVFMQHGFLSIPSNID